MAYPVIISYSSANPKERPFVTKLMDYLSTKGIQAVADDPNFSEHMMKQQLFNAQWLVLILTPEAIKSPLVESLVNTTFDRVRQGHMQGVLALAFSSNPVEPEDMPTPLWSTIRTYYAGESDEDHQRAFEKVVRTLGYSKIPVHTASSSATNWASTSGYQGPASLRPLPAHSRPAHSQKVRLIVSIIAALILIIFSATLLRSFLITNYQATLKADVAASVAANTKANTAATARAKGTASEVAKNSTPTAKQIYDQATKNDPTFSMKVDDKSQQWDKISPCTFSTNNTYQISTTDPNQYTRCMAHSIVLKNFAYQVMMTFSSDGDAGGLIFRADKELKNFYRFSLDSQAMYRLYKCQPCDDTSPSIGKQLNQNSTVADATKPIGQANILTVIVLNATIYLYVNMLPVDKLNGSASIGPGEIGLYAYSSNQPMTVTFKNVEVWKLPDNGKLQ